MHSLTPAERASEKFSFRRVALVHDWLTGLRGGERCLLNFIKLYPKADIYSLIHIPGSTSKEIDARVKQTSFLQKIPGIARFYRYCLPLYPFAVRSLDLSDYDLVISLSHAAAKNVQVGKHAVHICYCFTPMRYVWDQVRSYFGAKAPFLWPLVKVLRAWDVRGSKGVTQFVAISDFVAARIRKFYCRGSVVIFPPVDTSWIRPVASSKQGEAFLYAGALVPYKRPDLVVEAFNELGLPLWIVGSGPEESKLRSIAKENIHFLGRLSDEELASCYQRARALLFPGKEDFGMIPIECLAAGRPVIGAYEGALRESLRGTKPWTEEGRGGPGLNDCGVFMDPRQKSRKEALESSVRYFIEHESAYRVQSCIERAQLFSVQQFEQSWKRLIAMVIQKQTLQEVAADQSLYQSPEVTMLNLRTVEVLGRVRNGLSAEDSLRIQVGNISE